MGDLYLKNIFFWDFYLTCTIVEDEELPSFVHCSGAMFPFPVHVAYEYFFCRFMYLFMIGFSYKFKDVLTSSYSYFFWILTKVYLTDFYRREWK